MYHDVNKSEESITAKIMDLQDDNGCWNVLNKDEKYFPAYNYYAPNYKSTLWTLILLADIQTDSQNKRLINPLKIISNHFLDKQLNIFSLGKSHFPIPCLNGNMLYLHSYFNFKYKSVVPGIIDFFSEYQRFDDGDYKTPSSFPYYSNRSCYGKHTCYWGILKLFKGLSFIPKNKRSSGAKKLMGNCIDFILRHQVCFSSHDDSQFIHKNMAKLTFPNMYQSDYLEILWLLRRENIKSALMDRALSMLRSKMTKNSTWQIERKIQDLVIPISKNDLNHFITKRAQEVIQYYGV